MKGGEAVIETRLLAHGVDTAFTVPGERVFVYALEGLRRNG